MRALSAHRNFELLCEQARETGATQIVATDAAAAGDFNWSCLPAGTELIVGGERVTEVVQAPEVHTVVTAVVGSAGLRGTWAAVDAGKRIALANKETLIVAGPLVMQHAAARGAEILPVDSEHSAIFQSLQAGRKAEVAKLILTASGGPFRKHSREQLAAVTPAEALAHPTWQMGPKISVDSATMMNKALELIEARWLFDLPANQIEVVVHPQSIVHSLVEFTDGSTVAQMSPPDMRMPIQYALTFPERLPGPARRMDWSQPQRLEFEPPDEERFPALRLGRETAAAGGTAGAVLNAANEAAVARFLAGTLRFPQIAAACRSVLNHHTFEPQPSLERLLALDAWARTEVDTWTGP